MIPTKLRGLARIMTFKGLGDVVADGLLYIDENGLNVQASTLILTIGIAVGVMWLISPLLITTVVGLIFGHCLGYANGRAESTPPDAHVPEDT